MNTSGDGNTPGDEKRPTERTVKGREPTAFTASVAESVSVSHSAVATSNVITGTADIHERGADTISATGAVGPKPLSLVNPRNDDAWRADARDELDVENDARAFARLAISKEFRPPLAVGIFGAWGSGKSFFMQLVHRHVERLRTGTPSFEAPEASAALFHSAVVQIRFNAWHYAESNLWACLVDHIFTELAKASSTTQTAAPLDEMGTARNLTFEAAKELVASRKAQQVATKNLEDAQRRLREEEANLGRNASLYWAALRSVFEDKSNTDVLDAKKNLQDAAEEVGIPELAEALNGTEESWRALSSDTRKTGLIVRSFLHRLKSRTAVAAMLFTVFLLPLIVVAGVNWLAAWLPGVASFKAAISSAVSILGGVTFLMTWLGSRVRESLRKLETAKAAVDKVVDQKLKASKENEATSLNALDEAILKVTEASALFDASTKRYVEASGEFFGSTAGERLVRFVRARATDGSYAQHLGLIASIRKDFEALSIQMVDAANGPVEDKAQRQAFKAQVEALLADEGATLTEAEKSGLVSLTTPPSQKREPFQRIVLYIDDLDRCSAEKVVEVLQAIHMLLAFPLFVVFVAVDVRWVAGALKEQYPELVEKDVEKGRSSVSASDYLEKIFQVPYWLPAVDAQNGDRYLDTLMSPLFAQVGGQPNMPEAQIHPVSALEFVLSPEDSAALKEFLPFVGGSPRKVLRYVNVYRLIKASGVVDEAGPTSRPMAHRALAYQLALATASPETFRRWLTVLNELQLVTDEYVADAQNELTTRLKREIVLERSFMSALEAFGDFGPNGFHVVQLLEKYGRLAARYSFAQV